VCSASVSDLSPLLRFVQEFEDLQGSFDVERVAEVLLRFLHHKGEACLPSSLPSPPPSVYVGSYLLSSQGWRIKATDLLSHLPSAFSSKSKFRNLLNLTFSDNEILRYHCAPILLAVLEEDPAKLPVRSRYFSEIDSLVPLIIDDENPVAAHQYSNYVRYAFSEDRDRVMDADIFRNFFDMTGHQEVTNCVLEIVNEVLMEEDEIFLDYLLSCGLVDFLTHCLSDDNSSAFHMTLQCLSMEISDCLREIIQDDDEDSEQSE
jgi:hypothetical protein